MKSGSNTQHLALRRTITLDLPPEQIAWLDTQARATDRSRSAYARTLIARAMQSHSPSADAQ